MDKDIKLYVGATCLSPNEQGEIEFKADGGLITKIPAIEIHERLSKAQSVEEVMQLLKGSGAYIQNENSRVIIIATPNGAQIFSKDEPSRKVTVDRDLPQYVVDQILAINDYSEPRAVEKILIANRIIENPDKEAERTYTSFRDNMSFENEADNVGNNNTMDNGEIARARIARDYRENPNSGIYKEDAKEISEEARRRELEEKYGKASNRDSNGNYIGEDKENSGPVL